VTSASLSGRPAPTARPEVPAGYPQKLWSAPLPPMMIDRIWPTWYFRKRSRSSSQGLTCSCCPGWSREYAPWGRHRQANRISSLFAPGSTDRLIEATPPAPPRDGHLPDIGILLPRTTGSRARESAWVGSGAARCGAWKQRRPPRDKSIWARRVSRSRRCLRFAVKVSRCRTGVAARRQRGRARI